MHPAIDYEEMDVCFFVRGRGVCVCVCVSCHLAGLSPADLVPLSCDIIRAIISLGQIVLSEAQIV